MEKYCLHREEAILLIIDIQEKLMPAINKGEKIISNNGILIETAKNMDIPILVTEQYPKGLGKTVEELDEKLESAVKFSKMVFSSCSNEVLDHIQSIKRKKVIITGAEAHVCVFQTVRDLLKQGYYVFVAEDAVGSRTRENYDNAIALMREMGAVITNTETIVFDLLKESGTPEFKTLMKLIK
ncbi:nicotinamidase-related amidase [Sedimentibacter acidaminivorans]|uniref:Nicotinamidase-related amidase n=1 Tax=Sedimentibacter acidaminivorans TaxID=913099 RepID=A0ABS4GHI3_9FIRM|nr:hydrolase [Sedimentibacter acidaminivorans]MBP1927163.1 nicotinamidase-related amidase [Sedimentibacter acidaminivorans]